MQVITIPERVITQSGSRAPVIHFGGLTYQWSHDRLGPACIDRQPRGTGEEVAVVLTVGHGTRPAEALLAVLQHAGVTTLIDIRRFPGSRRHPQFAREALAVSLPAGGIRSEWQGEGLGGRRSRRASSRHAALVDAAFGGYADHMDTPAFRCAVQALVGRAEADERLAVMCAETLWWRCHRSLVADALVCRGVDVDHLIDVGRREPHRVRPTMRCGDDGWPVYDVPDTLPLRTKGGEEDRADGIAYERRRPR